MSDLITSSPSLPTLGVPLCVCCCCCCCFPSSWLVGCRSFSRKIKSRLNSASGGGTQKSHVCCLSPPVLPSPPLRAICNTESCWHSSLGGSLFFVLFFPFSLSLYVCLHVCKDQDKEPPTPTAVVVTLNCNVLLLQRRTTTMAAAAALLLLCPQA